MAAILSLESGEESSRTITESLAKGIADPRLYYATAEDRYYAMEYEASTERGLLKNPSSYARMLREHALDATVRTAIVSIGCGDARTDAELLKKLDGATHETSFLGVDLSRGMLENAASRLRQATFPWSLLHADFLRKTSRKEIDDATADAKRRIFLFLGNTFSNATPEETVPALGSSLRRDDYLLFDIFTRTGTTAKDDDALREMYWKDFTTPSERAFMLSPLLELGIDVNHGELKLETAVEPETRALQLTFRFVFTRTVTATYAGQSFTFAAGDGLRLFQFHVYDVEGLLAYLDEHNLQSVCVRQEGREALILARCS